jgi:hypothetical protein
METRVKQLSNFAIGKQNVTHLNQGCQMFYFHTKNPDLGIFWRALECKLLVYFMTILILNGCLEYYKPIWYSLWSFGFFPVLVCLDQEKSGNPDLNTK